MCIRDSLQDDRHVGIDGADAGSGPAQADLFHDRLHGVEAVSYTHLDVYKRQVDTQNGDDVLQILVGLENLLHLAGGAVMQ